MSPGKPRTMQKGVRSGVVAVITVVIVTAVGIAATADSGSVFESDTVLYVGWVSVVTFLGCLGLTKYYDHVPDSTPVHKLVTASVLVGVPAFASGLLLFTVAADPVPLVLGGVVTMWAFLYAFDWKDSSNPFFSAGEAPR